ncbi:hypothetical protein ACJX0J_013747, partial [Zea mays]
EKKNRKPIEKTILKRYSTRIRGHQINLAFHKKCYLLFFIGVFLIKGTLTIFILLFSKKINKINDFPNRTALCVPIRR